MKIDLIPIKDLKRHEKIDLKKAFKLMKEIKEKKYLEFPLLVEKNYLIILDGHHRFFCLKKLGFNYAPSFLVDYFSDKIDVVPRRKSYKGVDLKKIVIKTVEQNKLLPKKTTRHLLKFKLPVIKISLEELK